MSQTSKYSYLSWVRQGLATELETLDHLGASGPNALPQFDFQISVKGNGKEVAGAQIKKQLNLYEPGDIAGLQSNAVLKTNPANGVINFEPNFFPYIEFFDEDFPWRYTPFKANGGRLRPWISLVVLEENEFDRIPLQKDAILPSFKVKDGDNPPFPPADQVWAWAHTQVLSSSGNAAGGFSFPSNQSSARIICPRKLKPHTKYFAFLIPSFERGRRAGLKYPKSEIDNISTQAVAWGNGQRAFPFYYNWEFSTSENEDFESLVQKIKPRDLDSMIGKRWIDLQNTGYELKYKEQNPDEGLVNLDPDGGNKIDTIQQGAILMETALRVPGPELPSLIDIDQKDEAYFKKLEALLNLGADLQSDEVLNEEHPYLRNPFFQVDTTTNEDTIYDDPIILPPIYGRWHAQKDRVDKDEENPSWFNQINLDPRNRVAAGLGAEIVRRNQEAYVDSAWKQANRLSEVNEYLRKTQFSLALNQSIVHKYIRKMSPERILSISGGLQHLIKVEGKTTLKSNLYSKAIPKGLFSPAMEKISNRKRKWNQKTRASQRSLNQRRIIKPFNDTIDSIHMGAKLPEIPRNEKVLDVYKLIEICCTVKYLQRTPRAKRVSNSLKHSPPWKSVPTYYSDSDQQSFEKLLVLSGLSGEFHTPFFESLFDQFFGYFLIAKHEDKESFSFSENSNLITEQIEPKVAINKRVKAQLGDTAVDTDYFDSLVIEPEFPEPASLKLFDLGIENVVANSNLIPPNTYGVMVTNPQFVESLMLGMNHEMAKELLWREYPTDQRGSYFRKFWESRDSDGDLKDIKPLTSWGESVLGGNSLRANKEGQLVIVIRADLLMRFPNVVVYLQSAEVDPQSNQRVLGETILMPSFFFEAPPDIYFIGFNIAKTLATKDEGYFFVLRERPGEAQFGLDIRPNPNAAPDRWDSLNWETDLPNVDRYINLKKDIPKHHTRENISWGYGDSNKNEDAGNAANMAWILQQKPNSVAVHLSSMLPDQ